MSEPREWWIRPEASYCREFVWPTDYLYNDSLDKVLVVEKTDYDALKTELEQAKLIISGKTFNYPSDYGLLKADRDELQRLNQELDKSLSKSDAENDRLKGDNDKFLASDDCYYWTPERQKEFDALKAENDRLMAEVAGNRLDHEWPIVKERDALKVELEDLIPKGGSLENHLRGNLNLARAEIEGLKEWQQTAYIQADEVVRLNKEVESLAEANRGMFYALNERDKLKILAEVQTELAKKYKEMITNILYAQLGGHISTCAIGGGPDQGKLILEKARASLQGDEK